MIRKNGALIKAQWKWLSNSNVMHTYAQYRICLIEFLLKHELQALETCHYDFLLCQRLPFKELSHERSKKFS